MVDGWNGEVQKAVELDSPFLSSFHPPFICARPGTAAILATYCDKHISQDWNVVLILAQGTKPSDRLEIIRKQLNGKVPAHCAEKPTLVIAAIKAAGTGLNGLQNANYLIIFDIPFEKHSIDQAGGRINRPGQIHKCHAWALYSEDTNAELRIMARHKEWAIVEGTLRRAGYELAGEGVGAVGTGGLGRLDRGDIENDVETSDEGIWVV